MPAIEKDRIAPRKRWVLIAQKLAFTVVFCLVIVATWRLSSEFGRFRMGVNRQTRVTNLGDLPKYRDANATLATDPDRVVFFGDSITYQWDLSESFHNPSYLNRGIGGQTTGDMLIRFRQDVINLHPKAVVILAGVNDFAEHNPGGDENEQHKLENVEANDQTMAELAELHHIHPVFLSLTPMHSYTPRGRYLSSFVPARLILEQNKWLKSYCEQHGYQYIDLYQALIDERGLLRRQFSDDGLHPNEAGYKAMAAAFTSQFRP